MYLYIILNFCHRNNYVTDILRLFNVRSGLSIKFQLFVLDFWLIN